MTTATFLTVIGNAPDFISKFGVRLVDNDGKEIVVWASSAKAQLRLLNRLNRALQDLEAAPVPVIVRAA